MPNPPEWVARRSRLSHDSLGNQYLPALGRFLNILDDRIEDNEYEHHFITDIFPRWELHGLAALALIRDVENEMSPRRAFDRTPLSRWQRHEHWLPELVHCLWRARHQIDRTLVLARERADRAMTVYNGLKSSVAAQQPQGDPQLLRALRDEFAEFRRTCQELTKTIDEFPHSVLVT